MRVHKIIKFLPLVLVLVAGFLLFNPIGVLQYYNFKHKSERYYVDLSKACDQVIGDHPTGTNRYVNISPTDAALPKIIQDLHPLKIHVAPKSLWILHGGSLSFGIAWEQGDSPDTNQWVLSATCESHVTIVYAAKR